MLSFTIKLDVRVVTGYFIATTLFSWRQRDSIKVPAMMRGRAWTRMGFDLFLLGILTYDSK
jgi:hypothetical protein